MVVGNQLTEHKHGVDVRAVDVPAMVGGRRREGEGNGCFCYFVIVCNQGGLL
jgi:hypothetical protein